MKKKAFIGDLPSYVIVLFIFSILFIAFYYVVNQINIGWQASPTLGDTPKSMFGTFANRFDNVFDNVFLVLVVGYLLVTLLLAYFLRNSPIFAMLALIVMIVFGIVAVTLSNAFFDFSVAPGISTVTANFPITVYIGQRLPHIAIIFGTIFVILLYAKTRGSATL